MKKLTKDRTQKRTAEFTNESIAESLWGIAGGSAQQGVDLGKKLFSFEALEGFTKDQKKQLTGDLLEGEELNLKELHEEEISIEPGIDYSREIVHVGESLVTRENKEFENQLREIMIEIKKLAESSKELQVQFREVAVEQYVVAPGKYHKSFFTWLFSMIQVARRKVEDSGSWLEAMQSKKKSREYGAMAKKHGTTFSLSNERVVATQVG